MHEERVMHRPERVGATRMGIHALGRFGRMQRLGVNLVQRKIAEHKAEAVAEALRWSARTIGCAWPQ